MAPVILAKTGGTRAAGFRLPRGHPRRRFLVERSFSIPRKICVELSRLERCFSCGFCARASRARYVNERWRAVKRTIPPLRRRDSASWSMTARNSACTRSSRVFFLTPKLKRGD